MKLLPSKDVLGRGLDYIRGPAFYINGKSLIPAPDSMQCIYKWNQPEAEGPLLIFIHLCKICHLQRETEGPHTSHIVHNLWQFLALLRVSFQFSGLLSLD